MITHSFQSYAKCFSYLIAYEFGDSLKGWLPYLLKQGTSHGDPQRAKENSMLTHNDPRQSKKHSQQSTTIQKSRQRPTMTHNNPQQAKKTP